MAGWIEDRWLNKRKDPETGRRERTELYKKVKRYKVAGIPGVRARSFETLEEAKDWKATALTDSKRQEFIDPRMGAILLGDYIETAWWPTRRDPVSTAKTMKSRIWNHIIGSSIGRLPMNVIDDDHLRTWVAELRDRGLEDSTILAIWTHLTTVFKSAVGKRIPKNPCTEAVHVRPSGKGETKARAWESGEVHAIRRHLAEWYRVAVDLGVLAGMRQGEAFGFSPDDIDRDRMILHLRRQLLWDPSKPYFKLPKGNKERDIPLSAGLLAAIDAHAERHPPVELTLPWRGPGNAKRPTATVPLLVTTWHSNPVHSSDFNKKNMKPALAAAGLIAERDEEAAGSGWEPSRDKMFHRFRHTYASVQLAAGEDVVSLSHWMGHSSPEITFRIYAHFMPDRGQRGRTAIDAWLSASGD